MIRTSEAEIAEKIRTSRLSEKKGVLTKKRCVIASKKVCQKDFQHQLKIEWEKIREKSGSHQPFQIAKAFVKSSQANNQ